MLKHVCVRCERVKNTQRSLRRQASTVLVLEDQISALLSLEDFPPAVGQGAIGVTCRSDDQATRSALEPLLDQATGYALMAERAFLTTLDGSCRTPDRRLRPGPEAMSCTFMAKF